MNFKIYKTTHSHIQKKHINKIHKPIHTYKKPSITTTNTTTHHNNSKNNINQNKYTIYNNKHQNKKQKTIFNKTKHNKNTKINTKFLIIPSNIYILNKQLNPPKNTNNNNTKHITYYNKKKLQKTKIKIKKKKKTTHILKIITKTFIIY